MNKKILYNNLMNYSKNIGASTLEYVFFLLYFCVKMFYENFKLLFCAVVLSFKQQWQSTNRNQYNGQRSTQQCSPDIDFSDKGLLIPRVALSQTTSASPITIAGNKFVSV